MQVLAVGANPDEDDEEEERNDHRDEHFVVTRIGEETNHTRQNERPEDLEGKPIFAAFAVGEI